MKEKFKQKASKAHEAAAELVWKLRVSAVYPVWMLEAREANRKKPSHLLRALQRFTNGIE